MLAVALTAVLGVISWLVAQQDYPQLAQYGLLGLVVLALAQFAKSTTDRQARKLDEQEAYIRELHTRVETQIIPAAVKLAEVADRMMAHMERPR